MALALLGALWMLGTAGIAWAHEPGDEGPSAGPAAGAGRGPQGDVFVSQLIARQLAMARKLMEKGQYKEAIRRLEAMQAHNRAYNRYENAILHQTLGYAYASANDYAKAAATFAKALSFRALPEKATLSVMHNLGQLDIATGHYRKGIAVLEDWMARAPPADIPPQTRVLLGNAYFRQRVYAKAAVQLKKAIAGVAHADQSWFQLLANVYRQWGHYQELTGVLGQAVAAYPGQKAFWQQLAAVYRRRHDDRKAAAVLALACHRGLCNAEDRVYLAQLYLFLGAPLKSAHVMQVALKDDALRGRAKPWMLLAQSLQQARELDRAEAAYRKAVKRSKDDGTAAYRLGQLYVQREQWQSATDALTRALHQGHLSSPGRARLLLGVAHLYLGQRREAAKAFKLAEHDPDVKAEARRWLRQVHLSAGGAAASQRAGPQSAGD